MGSSTTTLQSVLDFINVAGEISPVRPTGGYNLAAALTLATDVMGDILSQRFNWKFNSYRLAPFYTNSYQQDYPTVNETGIGWFEHANAVDINSASLPKPKYWPECVRDLESTDTTSSPPRKISWEYNQNLEYGVWPGAGVVYTYPLGLVQLPTNPLTAIQDANGNILVLTTYGVTATRPVAPAGTAAGFTIQDGTCVWTVCNPFAQGFRTSELAPQQGVVYQINLIAQRKPPIFTKISQTLDPLPDDYAPTFRKGFRAYCYSVSSDPKERASFPAMRAQWMEDLSMSLKQGDRELEDKGFYPDSSSMAQMWGGPIGPAWPYGGSR